MKKQFSCAGTIFNSEEYLVSGYSSSWQRLLCHSLLRLEQCSAKQPLKKLFCKEYGKFLRAAAQRASLHFS
jgi:hypothetical protein